MPTAPLNCLRSYGLEVYTRGPTPTYLTSFSGFVYEDIYKRLRKRVKIREKQARQKAREEDEKERLLGLKDLEWALQNQPSKGETP